MPRSPRRKFIVIVEFEDGDAPTITFETLAVRSQTAFNRGFKRARAVGKPASVQVRRGDAPHFYVPYFA